MANDITRTRVELKFLVPAPRVEEVVARMPEGDTQAYGVKTVYFDRPDRALTRTALESPNRCMKVRTREYLDGSPYLWVEVKTRSGAWTRKARFKVDKSSVPQLLDGGMNDPLILPCPCAACVREMREASLCLRELGGGKLVPVGVVSARRRTFGNGDLPVRFTLDQDIAYFRSAANPYEGNGAPSAPELGEPILTEVDAVLELKHPGRVPPWCGRVVAGLKPSGYSKFRTLARCLDSSLTVSDHVDRL